MGSLAVKKRNSACWWWLCLFIITRCLVETKVVAVEGEVVSVALILLFLFLLLLLLLLHLLLLYDYCNTVMAHRDLHGDVDADRESKSIPGIVLGEVLFT